jgi:hypothetical protein
MAVHEQHSGAPPERVSFTLEQVNVEQYWMGAIDDIQGDSIAVALTNPSTDEEEFMTIDMSQISEKDQPYVVEGAPFEWTVGHVDDISGRRIGVSISEEAKEEARRAGIEASRALIAGESQRHTFTLTKEHSVVEELSPGQEILYSLHDKSINLKIFETTDESGNPQLRVFHKHVPQLRIAPPGTHLPTEENGTDTSTWRIEQTRFNEREQKLGSFAINYQDIADALPGVVADWAEKTFDSTSE